MSSPLVSTFCAASLALSLSAQPTYVVTEISPPGASANTIATAISETGLIAGETFDFFAFDNRAFVLDEQGQYRYLQPLPGMAFSGVGGVSDDGDWVLGISGTDIAHASAAMWDRSGRPTDVGTLPGHSFALAVARNPAGEVIGFSTDGINLPEPFRWHNGTAARVPMRGYRYAAPVGFDVAGNIAATAYSDDGVSQGCFVHPSGVVSSTGVLPGGSWSQLDDVNALGVAVGTAQDVLFQLRAAVFFGGAVAVFPNLPEHFGAQLGGVNNHGSAVGISYGGEFGTVGVVTVGDRIYDLNALLDRTSAGWVILSVVDINDDGVIVGTGIRPHALPTAVMLTPTSGPAAEPARHARQHHPSAAGEKTWQRPDLPVAWKDIARFPDVRHALR